MTVKPLSEDELRTEGPFDFVETKRLKELFAELLLRHPYIHYKWDQSESVEWNKKHLENHDKTFNKIRLDIKELFLPLVK